METRLWEALYATSVFLIPSGMIFVRKRKAYVYEIFLWSISTSILFLREELVDVWSEVLWRDICIDKWKAWMQKKAKTFAPGE